MQRALGLITKTTMRTYLAAIAPLLFRRVARQLASFSLTSRAVLQQKTQTLRRLLLPTIGNEPVGL